MIDFYLGRQIEASKLPLEKRENRKGSGRVQFTKCELVAQNQGKRTLSFEISYENKTENTYRDVKVSLDIKDFRGEHMVNITNNILDQKINLEKGPGKLTLDIHGFNLPSGEYFISLFMASDQNNSEIFDSIDDAIMVTINNNGFYQTGKLPPVPTKVLFDFEFKQKG